MKELENNAFFWQKLDTLMFSSDCTIDRPKGSTHFKYSNLVYPVDYGFLSDTTAGSDQDPIDLLRDLFQHILLMRLRFLQIS